MSSDFGREQSCIESITEKPQEVCDYNFFMLPAFQNIMLALLRYWIFAGHIRVMVREAELKKLKGREVDFCIQVNIRSNLLG